MRNALLIVLAVLAIGCKGGKIEASSAMQELSAKVSKGMKQDEVLHKLGEPDKKMNDPASGIEMWSYHSDNGTLLVSFNIDEVVDVRSMGV